MIVRELLARFGLEVKQEEFQKADAAVNGLKKAAGMLAGVFVAGKLAQGFSALVRSASDSAEVLNVIRKSFGDYADEVIDWSSESAKAMGRSSNDMAQYAAQLGAILTPLTKNEEASSKMSRSLTELAVDLGSFFNAAEPDVLQALQSALVGQARPMMRYGVVLNEATLAQYALSQGITKSIKDMSQAEVIALRYGFIMASTTNAQGDAAKTADGYANSSKALQAALKDLGESVGQVLLPGATKMLHVSLAAIKTFRSWIEGTKILNVVFGALGIAIGAVAFVAGVYALSKIGALSLVFIKLAGSAGVAGNAMLLAQLKMVAVGIAVILLVALIALLAEDMYQFFTGGESLIGEYQKSWNKLLDEFVNAPFNPDDHFLMKALRSLVQLLYWVEGIFADVVGAIILEVGKIAGPIDLLKFAWNVPIVVWRQTVLRFLEWFAGKVKDVPVLGRLAGMAVKAGDAVSDAISFDIGKDANLYDRAKNIAMPVKASAHEAFRPAAGVSTVVNAPVRAEFTITQQPGESGDDLAHRISSTFESLLETQVSHALAATTPALGGS
jgi:hypothetical protein